MVGVLIFFTLLQFQTFAQVDSLQRQFSGWFDGKTTAIPAVYSGKTYSFTPRARFGHQFLDSRLWQSGAVHLNDQVYFDVPVMFDIQEQQLVVRAYDQQLPYGISPDMRRVHDFEIGQSHFVRYEVGGNSRFYEQLYKGEKLELLAFHQKTIGIKPDGEYFEDKSFYYLKHEGKLTRLHNKRSLRKIAPDARVIARKIKSRQAKFKLAKEKLLVEFMRRFDEAIR